MGVDEALVEVIDEVVLESSCEIIADIVGGCSATC